MLIHFQKLLVGQFLFFAKSAHHFFNELVDEETNEKASLNKRTVYASLCIALGVVLSHLVHFYTKKAVKSIVLLNGGRYINIKTANYLFAKDHLIPTRNLQFKKLNTPTNYHILNVKVAQDRLKFIIDKRGHFSEPQLFKQIFNS
ncbi:hypothetical protein HDU92_000042 [Lobulomyces angularis]|nr:hypothetical protein HDU92_000042 [Lobulomyces angularis]